MFGYAWSANLFNYLSFFFVVFLLAGCSSSPPKSVDYLIYSEADSLLNRDAADRPLSVVLNVYQLKSRGTFARLTFEDFVSGKVDAELLDDDFLQKSEIVALPGDKQTLDMQLLPETQYLGVVAIYRKPADQQWRYLIPVEQIRKKSFWRFSDKKTVSLHLHDCYMRIDGVTLDLIPGQKAGEAATCPVVPQVSTAEVFTQ